MKDSSDQNKRRYDAGLVSYINNLFESSAAKKVVEGYIVYLKSDADVSERTQTLYIQDLFGTYKLGDKIITSAEYTFFNFLSLQDFAFSGQITREVIRRYIVWLSNNHIANSSINRRISAVRSFYKYLLIYGIIETSPIPVNTHQRNSPRSSLSVKMDRHIPDFLTHQEIEQLLNTPNLAKPAGLRNRAILELFYASGLRVSELWQLNLDSFNLESREIRVLGKGSKIRVTLMGLPAVSALDNYLKNGRSHLSSGRQDDALFLNNRGKRLSIREIQLLLKHYSAAVGLEKNVHPHILRHTFATHMLDGGADLRVVQELLGHADLSSTQIYTHVTKQQARKVYLTAHPMAQEKDDSHVNQGSPGKTPPEIR